MARGNWEEFLRPHFETAGTIMSAQMDRVIEELRLIKGAVRDSGPDPVVGDKYIRRTVTATGAVTTTELPGPNPGEMFIIEAVFWAQISEATNSIISVAGQPRIWFAAAAATDLSDQIVGLGFPVFPGENIVITQQGVNSAVDVVIRRVQDGSVPKMVRTGRSMELVEGPNRHEPQRDLIAGRAQG